MTVFTETALRHYCRNPKCRAKLKAPTSDRREAFCSLKSNGCRDRFYRLRCYICEEKKTGRLDAHTCGRRKCKNTLQTMGGMPRPSDVEIGSGNAHLSGVRKPLQTDRPWHIVAGPELGADQLRAASVPEGAGGRWEGGEYRRIEAKNRALLNAAEHDIDGVVPDACAACGREDDLKDVSVGGRWTVLCYGCIDKQREARPWATVSRDFGDLSIPDFLLSGNRFNSG